MVEGHDTFVLADDTAPLEICEARGRKGSYARVRDGEIDQLTCVSDL